MTDKEYVRRYTDTAERVQRDNPPPIKPGDAMVKPSDAMARRHRDEFIRQFRRVAKDIAEKNVRNMPTSPNRGRAMKRSIRRVRDGAGVLHVQPKI